MSRRILAHPSYDRPDRHVAFPPLGPQETEPKAERAYAAPSTHDITLVQLFQLGDAGAMVRDDRVDGAVEQSGPQGLAIRRVADRWAAFEFGTSVGNGIRLEAKVMEARLDCQFVPGCFGAADDRESLRG